ncbi:MAG: hypothetical protein H8D23_06980 [Candidatus Brocadiales bacterium]|nr:hypothetical protein [Candidatus Brocadiales bacterium]
MKHVTKLLPIIVLLLLGCEGPEGPPGEDGNTDVEVVVFSFTLSQGTATETGMIYEKLLSEIDASIVNNGTVIAYVEAENNTYEALPSTFCVDTNDSGDIDYCLFLTYWYSLNTLSVEFSSSTTGVTLNPSFTMTIKAVILGGNPTLSREEYYDKYFGDSNEDS